MHVMLSKVEQLATKVSNSSLSQSYINLMTTHTTSMSEVQDHCSFSAYHLLQVSEKTHCTSAKCHFMLFLLAPSQISDDQMKFAFTHLYFRSDRFRH